MSTLGQMPSRLLDSHQAFKLASGIAKYVVIAYIGALIGTLIALAIVICFALIIVSGVANIYYATIFLAVGWGYAWKILKKNKI